LSFEVSQTIEKTEGPFYCEKWGRDEINIRTDLARPIYEKNKEDRVLKAMSRFRQLEEQQQQQ